MRIALSATAALLMLGTAAGAADMRPLPYKAPPPPIMALPTWTGFYLGVNLGGAFGEDRLDFGISGVPFAAVNNAFHGITGGGQIGYNWQFNSFVAGFEADFQGSSLKNSLVAPCPAVICGPLALSAAFSHSIPWWGTARARIGYAQDSWLIYATGGYAYAAVDTSATATAGLLGATFNSHDVRSGWTVGGGIEVGLYSNWSVKAEYLYVDLGSANTAWNFVGINNGSHVTMNVARAGLNFRF